MQGAFDLELLKKRIQKQTATSSLRESTPVAAVAIIINPREGGSILFIKRREREGDPWSGQIAFPGGHKAPEDRDYLQTAIREAEEEVGITLREDMALGHLPVVRGHSQKVQVVPYIFELRDNVPVRLNEEASEGFWAPLNSLRKMRAIEREVEVEDGKLRVHAYVYEGRVIWGLTFRIINVLLDKRLVSG